MPAAAIAPATVLCTRGKLVPIMQESEYPAKGHSSIHKGQRLSGAYERHVVISDYHHRTYQEKDWVTGNYVTRHAHDVTALAVVNEFMEDFDPHYIHYLGDMVDFFAVSRFCKAKPDQDEVAVSLSAMRRIARLHREQHPAAGLAYYLGNHEARWQAYIESNASALAGVVGLNYNSIFDAAYLGLAIYKYRERVPIIPGVLELTHGDKVRTKSGYTAHAMLERGVSGVSGHTHRLGAVYKTTRQGVSMWIENGCLCDTSPEYTEYPDWQQGFTVLYVDKREGRFHMDVIPIIQTATHRRIMYGGEVWEVPIVHS